MPFQPCPRASPHPPQGAEAAPGVPDWRHYLARARQVVGRFQGQFQLRHFDYQHPARLQPATPRRLRKPYPARVAFTDWGPADAPIVLCCGGVTNVAMRFNYLAADLSGPFRVVCMDWLGRGRSAWLADEGDYSLATYVEQLRQMIRHLGDRPVLLLGSSMGGSAAIELAARQPSLVQRLVLNDIGPYIPAARRRRRAETIARHHVFRCPDDLLRRTAAAHKHDGPLDDDIRFNLSFHQTRWSDEEGGRIYRHDVRALQAYRRDAQHSLVQWDRWRELRCPLLLVHGLLSDALRPATVARMQREQPLTLMQVPDTGHTPLLADRNQTWFIRQWLLGGADLGRQWSTLHAPPREAWPRQPPAIAPAQRHCA